MKDNLESVFLRLGYALREAKDIKNSTIILGAGCSLSTTKKDISTWGIMKQCLLEHGCSEINMDDITGEELYRDFINLVWQGKAKREREQLLKNKLSGLKPSDGHLCLRDLVEKGYIHNIITTNFDMLLEEAFDGLSYKKRVGDGEYYSVGDNPSFNLLKIHGDLNDGDFRFAPHELSRLPDLLHKDIYEKTSGPLIFIGYRGQDIGLMNSLSTLNEYAVYWINVDQFDNGDMYTNQKIRDFMDERLSASNYLYGKEFGDFNQIMEKLRGQLIYPTYNTIIQTKEFNLSNEWRNTSIVEMLRIYSRVYELFLDILEISNSIQKKLSWNSENPAYTKSYYEHLNSYLYFFNSKKLPSNLLHIPNNELDALILGVAIEVLVRTIGNDIIPKEFILDIQTEFNEKYNQSIINDSFWIAVEKIVSSEFDIENVVDINMQNKLALKTYDVPFREFNELLRVVSFLALLIPINSAEIKRIDSKYRIRQFLSGKYEDITLTDKGISIDLGTISSEDAEELYKYYINDLPDVHILDNSSSTNKKRYIVYKAKWININLEVEEKNDIEQNNNMHFYKLVLNQSKISETHFLKLKSIYDNGIVSHIELQFDKDIKKFLKSDKVGMFAIGSSGCGKTTAIQNFIHYKTKDTITIIVSPKNTAITRYGLSLFLDLDIANNNEDTILKNINHNMNIRNSQLLFIFDGLNEINDTVENQQIHYCKLLELADKLYDNQYKNIKLLITCREQAYYQYKNVTTMQLNHIYFYNDNNFNDSEDASYKIALLNNSDKQCLYDKYISTEIREQINNISMTTSGRNFNITDDAITPLFIAIVGESLNSYKGVNVIKNGGNVYDLFSNVMLGRLEQADVFLARKIIYAYFDLIVDLRNTNIEITKFKVLNTLELDCHTYFDGIVNKMIDVNILLKDYSNLERIKFQHDKIEEFFFKEYIEEYDYKGIDFFNTVFYLCQKNVIYQGGVLEYFLTLEKKGKLKDIKEILISLFINHIKFIPKITIEILSFSQNLSHIISYLISANDIDGSKKMLSIIIWGLDQNLQDYSAITYDLRKIISELQKISDDTIMTNESRSYICFFESKLNYFVNDYTKALSLAEMAKNLVGGKNRTLSTKIDIHYSVILMEQGYSKKCIELLEKDFETYKNGVDLNLMLEVGIELGRALNHSGQTDKTLYLYSQLLEYKNEINDIYVLARICEQKANVLNNLMYNKLQYGFVNKKELSEKEIEEVNELYLEAMGLYDESIDLLLSINAIFTYSGVIPEKINTIISYSFSIEQTNVDDCSKMIKEFDRLFDGIKTPFETDYNISKAYYYEYINKINQAEKYIEIALENALNLHIKNKEAKCRCFYAQFLYRRILNLDGDIKKMYTHGIEQLKMAIAYYEQHTIVDGNIVLNDCYTLKQKYDNISFN